MNLRVIREPSVNGATVGVLFADGRHVGFSLEDQIREVPGQPVSAWKIPGETAIPAGRYRVVLTPSQKFGRVLPELMDVPGFTGIRLHPGNVATDTEGCLLLGFQRVLQSVSQSQAACARVQDWIKAAADRGDGTWILIENPLT